MEVAVNPIVSSSVRSLSKTLIAAGLVIAVAGCSDTLTYSRDSRAAGLTQYNQGHYDLAAGSFQNAVKQNPRDYESYYWLGVAYDASKDYQQAIQAYRASLDVQQLTFDGQHDKVFRRRTLDGLAIAISKSPGRSNEIQQILDKTAGHETADDALLVAKIFSYSGDADSAIDAYNRAVLLDPNDVGISREAGLYFEKIHKTQMAEPLLKRAYTANPQDDQVASALRHMGIVPGPSLKNEDEMAKPLIPRGPIPEIDISRAASSANQTSQAQVPRD
jgi:tetratricopeptide (TPR) repeat protein